MRPANDGDTAMNSLLHELKRRKVFRVAIVYAASGFVMLQAADLILPRLGVPEWALTLIVVLLLLGFPIALALAWALELTADGVRVTPPSAADAAVRAPALLGRRTLVVAALLVALGVGLGAGLFRGPSKRHDAAAEAVADRSIAVLPFADFSPNADQQWFSDGLAEEILNALARLPDLRVASRTGSFQFRAHGGQLSAIAESLGVAHVLEGSVRRDGERVRVTAQLIRASDDAHVWSQTFDREARDVMRVQEEIAYEIARTMQTALQPDELARMVAVGTNSLAAYEAFLRYWHLSDRAAELEDWSASLDGIRELERAVEHDPRFFRALAEAASFWMYQLTPTNRAFGIDAASYRERHDRALRHLRAAEAVAPDVLSRLQAERLRARLELRLREAVGIGERIIELSPTGEEYFLIGLDAVAIGRYHDARRWFAEAAQRPPHELARGRAGLAANHHRVDAAAGAAIVDQLLAEGSTGLNDLYQSHRVLLAAGRIAEAGQLGEEYLARSPSAENRLLLRVRQLCAEHRVDEAEALVGGTAEELANDGTLRWHVSNYLGRPAEAAESLRHYDDAGELFTLSTFLAYTFFDPQRYPKLSAALRRNGSLRTEVLPIPYACPQREEPT
jgi:TolB-like protein